MKKKKIKKLIDKEIQKFAEMMPPLKPEKNTYLSVDAGRGMNPKQSPFNSKQELHPFFDGRAGA